LKGSQ